MLYAIFARNFAYYLPQLPQGLVLRITFQQHYRSYVWCLINVPCGPMLFLIKGGDVLFHKSLINFEVVLYISARTSSA